MDDLLVIGGDIQLIEKIKRKLMDQFKMTDMGDVSLVLSMQVTRDRQGKTLTNSQENYTKSILERFVPTANRLVLQASVLSFLRNNRKVRC